MKRVLSFLLAFVMVLALFGMIPAFADDPATDAEAVAAGYYYRVGDTVGTGYYTTMTEVAGAVNALASATPVNVWVIASQTGNEGSQVAIDYPITLQGLTSDRTQYTLKTTGYFASFFGDGTTTVKNLTITGTHGFRAKTNKATSTGMTVILDNVNITLTSGLLVNLQYDTAGNGLPNVFTIQNNSVIAATGGNDPVIAQYGDTDNWTINITDSTVTNSRAVKDAGINDSVIGINGGASSSTTIHVSNSTLSNLRAATNNGTNVRTSSVFYFKTPSVMTVTLDSTSILEMGATGAGTENLHYMFVNSAGGYTWTDNGATYRISADVQKTGFFVPRIAGSTERFAEGGVSIANGNCYRNAEAAATLNLAKVAGTFAGDEQKVKDGNFFKIGGNYYTTLAAAVSASVAGDTIYQIANFYHTSGQITIDKANVAINGQGFRFSSTVGYTFIVKATVTFKNIYMVFQAQGISYRPQIDGELLTLDGVTGRNNGGLFAAIGHGGTDTKSVPAGLTVKDSSITAYGEEPFLMQIAGVTWTVNILNSTLVKEGSGGHNYVLNFSDNLTMPTTLNIDGTSKLINNATAAKETPLLWMNNRTITATIGSGAILSLNSASGATAGLFFGGAGNLTLDDNGGRYTVNQYLATKGVTFPTVANVNGSPAVAQTVFTDGAVNIPNGGTYKKEDATAATVFTLGTRDLTYAELVEAGSIWRIGPDENVASLYGSLTAAYNAAQENDTIYLLANTSFSGSISFTTPGVTVDGLDHTITVPSGYAFIFNNTTTLKNMTLTFTNQGFSFNPTDDDQVFTLDHVTATNGYGLFAAVGHTGRGMIDGKRARVVIKDSALTSGGEEVMLIQQNAYWTVEIINSTLTNNGSGGSDKNHNMVIQFADVPHPITLEIKGTSKLITNSTQEGGGRPGVIWINACDSVHEIRIEAEAELAIGTVKKAFGFIAGGGNAKLTDGGAKYTASAAAQKVGYTLPEKITSGDTVVIGFSNGTSLYKTGKAFAANTEATEPITYTAAAFSTADFATVAGASMKTGTDGNGLRFTTHVGASLANIGTDIVIGISIVPTKLARLEGSHLNTAILGENQYYAIVYEGGHVETDGSVTYAAALLGLPENATSYQTQYSAQSYLTVTYSDGTTATFYSAYSKADNARSLYDVAKALKAQPGYTEIATVENVIATVEAAAQ